MDKEKKIKEKDNQELDVSSKPQFDSKPYQLNTDVDLLDMFMEDSWNQAKIRDEFTPLILKLSKDGAQYHINITLAESENRAGFFYFCGRHYVPHSNKSQLQIIQLAYKNVPGGHLG